MATQINWSVAEKGNRCRFVVPFAKTGTTATHNVKPKCGCYRAVPLADGSGLQFQKIVEYDPARDYMNVHPFAAVVLFADGTLETVRGQVVVVP